MRSPQNQSLLFPDGFIGPRPLSPDSAHELDPDLTYYNIVGLLSDASQVHDKTQDIVLESLINSLRKKIEEYDPWLVHFVLFRRKHWEEKTGQANKMSEEFRTTRVSSDFRPIYDAINKRIDELKKNSNS